MTASPVPSGAGDRARALPPETLEGWYALHQIYSVDRAVLREWVGRELPSMLASAAVALAELSLNGPALAADGKGSARAQGQGEPGPDGSHARGWSVVAPLIGSAADVMFIHFRPTLDEIALVQQRLAREPLLAHLSLAYSFLSVTEAGLYHLTAELAREAASRGGTAGDAEFQRLMAPRAEGERASAHVQKRLYPPLPADMPYVCFYPMSKRREPGQNWYALPIEERSRLMQAHGLTGRRYAGRVQQVITGAIGLDAWEWGVTLFARDPLEFKKLVTEMRFDEVSARFAEFGAFYVGKVAAPAEWLATLNDTVSGPVRRETRAARPRRESR